MSNQVIYNNILVAIDFSDAAKQVIERTVDLFSGSDATVTILHVVEYYPLIGIGADLPTAYNWDVPEKDLLEGAEMSLDNFITENAPIEFGEINKVIAFGPTHIEIVNQAKNDNSDLIIVGSHGRHGIALLLGSTANGVLHHAECDVLAVRIK